MAVHKVTIHEASFELSPKGNFAVEVAADGLKMGELVVGNADIRWRPRHKQYECSMSWEQFDRTMRRAAGRPEVD